MRSYDRSSTMCTAASSPRLTQAQNFCRNEYSVTGPCNRSSRPLANSRYSISRDIDGEWFLLCRRTGCHFSTESEDGSDFIGRGGAGDTKVASQCLEMAQNTSRFHWPGEEVDMRLQVMKDIYRKSIKATQDYGVANPVGVFETVPLISALRSISLPGLWLLSRPQQTTTDDEAATCLQRSNMLKIYMLCSENEDKTHKLDCANRKTCEEGMEVGIEERVMLLGPADPDRN